MCIAFYTLAHPDYALIICSNRDEFLDRPTSNAHFHDFQPSRAGPPEPTEVVTDLSRSQQPGDDRGWILSGRDLRAGGTWLGINRAGQIALLTNITEEYQVYPTSRGDLTSSFLMSHETLDEFVAQLTAEDNWKAYAGFNLLLLSPTRSEGGDVKYEGRYVTNSGGGGKITGRKLHDDEMTMCGGITNGIESLDGCTWPKLVDGLTQMGTLVGQSEGAAHEDEGAIKQRLFEILSGHTEEPILGRTDLRKTIRVEPMMVPAPGRGPRYYGTRLATLVLVDRMGEVTFVERDVWMTSPEGGREKAILGSTEDDRVFRFAIEQQTAPAK